MNARSIRFRLTAWYTVILALSFAALGAGAWYAISDSINDTLDGDLRARLAAMRDYLRRQVADQDSGPLEQELAEQAALAPAGANYRLAGRDGRWIYRSPGAESWNFAIPLAASLPADGNTETVYHDGKPIRVLSARVEMGVIQIGVAMDEFREMLNDFTWTALLASPFLLFLAAAGGWWMSRRALRPVDRIARTAEAINALNLSERLPVSGTGDELDRLTRTLNSMLDRIEEAFQRVTQFTADASHELRTPVAVIRTTAELARGKPRTEQEYAVALDRILAESERTTSLIEDLMFLAHADSGAEGLSMEPVSLGEVTREACAAVAPLAEAAQLAMDTGTIPDHTVLGDEPSLRRLLLVLLDNAIKYTPPGGRVSVSLSAAGTGVVVEVRDTGIGIPAADLPRIFERFYRAAKDRSRNTGGAGLGLSIARWIAGEHGATIRAESTPGEGSIFRVTFTRHAP
jgi:heavy metal sensor kinase